MRTVDAGVISAMDSNRVISGRITVRDLLPRWTPKTCNDSSILDNACYYDMDIYGGSGILRVMSVYDGSWNYRLYYQYVSDPTGTWPAWTNSGITLRQASGLALCEGRVFYQASADNDYYYRDFNGSTFGSATKWYEGNAYPHQFAAVNTTRCYIISNYDGFLMIKRVDFSGTPTAYEFHGRIKLDSDNELPIHCSAINKNGRDHIFITERGGTLAMTTEFNGTWYSDLRPVIPIDATDEDVMFIPGKCTSLSLTDFVLTGITYQKDVDIDGYEYHSYHFGKTRNGQTFYSNGRESFIGTAMPYTEKYIQISGESYKFSFQAGRILLIGTRLWYACPGYAKYSDATNLFHSDYSARKYTTDDIDVIDMACKRDGPGGVTVNLIPGAYSALMKPGAELTVDISYDDNWATLGTFDIDAVFERYTSTEGKSYQLVAQSNAMKRVREWSPDNSYDYWSQSKVSKVSTDLEYLVRAAGEWDEQGYGDLYCDTMNEECYIYCTNKASRGGLVTATFGIPSDQAFYGPCVGVMQRFYRETTDEAKSRLGEDVVNDYDIGVNGVVFTYHDYGTPTWELYAVKDGVFTSMDSASASQYHNQQIDLALQVSDGLCRCWYKATAATTWTLIMNWSIDEDIYKRDDHEGRHAILCINASTWGTCYEFRSTDPVIPMQDTYFTSFPSYGTVKINTEKITYTGKSNITAKISSLAYSPGEVIESQEVLGSYPQSFADLQTRNYVRQKFELDEDTLCFGVDVYVRKIGDPEDGLEVGLYKGPVSTNLPLGRKLCSATMAAEDVGSTLAWHTFEWGYGEELKAADADAGNLWILMTRVEDPANPDASNYYSVQLDDTGYGASGYDFATFDDTDDTWDEVTGFDMSFKIYGGEDIDDPVVYISNIADPSHFGYYDNAALVVTGGKGEGRSFRVKSFSPTGTSNLGLFYLDEPADGIIDMSSEIILAPTLIVGERGYDSTTAIGHSLDEKVSIYVDNLIRFDYIQSYTGEKDMRVEDVLKEIMVKAGSYANCQKWEDDYIYLSGSGWQISSAYGLGTIYDPIVRFYIGSMDATQVGVIFKGGYSLTTGLAVTVGPGSPGNLSFYTVTGGSTFTLDERYPIQLEPYGWITMSVHEPEDGYHYLSCWIGDRYVGSFRYTGSYTDGYVRFCSYNSQTILADLSECYQRVDNFIMDMGMDGNRLINRLLRERGIIYRDDSAGELYAFVNRVRANSSANTLATQYEYAVSGDKIASRLRCHAYKTTASLNWDYLDGNRNFMASYGNVFKLVDLQLPISSRELLQEVNLIKEDIRRQYYNYSIKGAADPRIEAGDLFYVTLPGMATFDLDVDSVQFQMVSAVDMVAFDMNVVGGKEIES